MIIGTDSPSCDHVKSGVGNRTIYLNSSKTSFVLLKPLSQEVLGDLIGRFRLEQVDWIRGVLTSEDKKFPKTGNPIYGAKSYFNSQYNRRAFRFFIYDAIPEVAWKILRSRGNSDNEIDLSIIKKLPSADVRRFVDLALGASIESIANVFNNHATAAFIMPELEEKLSTMGAETFLSWISDLCVKEISRPKGVRTTISYVPFVFMLFLHRLGYVLFPDDPVQYYWYGGSLPIFDWLTPRRKKLYDDTTYALKQINHIYSKNRVSDRIDTLVRQILLRTNIRTERDVSSELQNLLYDFDVKAAERARSRRVSTLTNKIMRLWSVKAGVELVTERSGESIGKKLFGWTFAPLQYQLPPRVSRSYRPSPVIIAWGEVLEAAIGRAKHKWIADLRTAANTWLAYLVTLKNPPETIKDVVRGKHIISPNRVDGTFISFVDSLDISTSTKNGRILHLSNLFKFIIDTYKVKFLNPIEFDLDRFKEAGRRGKTPRTPLSREMLGYIKEFNRRDGAAFGDVSERLPSELRDAFQYDRYQGSGKYAFSQDLAHHFFERVNEQTGEVERKWWPGIAVLLELLLEVPVRGFQARFLDSGDADEMIVDLDALKMVPNPLPTAKVNRRQGIFYLAEDLKREPIVGLYINSNKTGIDRDGGYSIPWCPPALLESLPWLMNWNHENGNIGECPISERINFNLLKNEVVKNSIPRTSLIFRDPWKNDGWPCSKRRLASYWVTLLTAVEAELKAQGFEYDLTREVVEDDGSIAREALFDIHTLRVSGITAMIEAGMPVELVQEVVGHASIVMTLYYYRVRAAVLNDRLKQLHDGDPDAIGPADIPELRSENVDDLVRHLFNSRNFNDAAGLQMLSSNPSGLGNGSFNVYPDGICPGGECATGGEAIGTGFGAVSRHRACSVCRYRVTGPMFLAGLVHNANRLMYELRKIGEQIRDLVQVAKELEEQGKSARIVRNQIDGLYRQTEDVSVEWSAEVQYVHAAVALLREQSEAGNAAGGKGSPALLSGTGLPDIVVKLENKPDFILLQKLVQGRELLPGFRPNLSALADHREFLNEVLDGSGIDPFLLRLDGPMRDQAAALLGEAIVALVPEERLNELKSGTARLGDFDPNVGQLAQEMADQVARSRRIDLATLRGVDDLKRLLGNGDRLLASDREMVG